MKVIFVIVLLTILYIFGMSKLEVMRLSDLIMLSSTSTSTKTTSSISSEKISSNSVAKVSIIFTGSINKPGTYEVTPYLYLKDVLTLAGGLTDNADLEAINLEYVVAPEDTSFYIPSKSNNPKISINTATIEELELLPSIGVVSATNIVNYRNLNGGFKTIDEILKVDRIGVKTFDSIKDLIKL